MLIEGIQEINLPQRASESYPLVAKDERVEKITLQATQIAITLIEAEFKRILLEELPLAMQ